MVAPVLRVAAPRTLSDLLKFEVDTDYVREIDTLGANQTLVLGSPVAKTAAGKIVQLAPAATDGTEKCVGLSLFNRTSGGSDILKGITYLARGPSIVADFGIVWPVGTTDPQKAAAVADLTSLGILVRPAY